MSEDKPIISIGSVRISINLSNDVETAKKQWKTAKKIINTYLEVKEEPAKPDAQQSTAPKKKKKPWSNEEEEIIANNLDKKPAQLDELLSEEGYERTRGAIHQKKKEIAGQKGGWSNEDKLINQDRYSDENFLNTLLKYLWRNTDWKRFESRDDRIEEIQDLIKDRYGMNITKEEVEQIIKEDEAEAES